MKFYLLHGQSPASHSHVKSCGICDGQNGSGADFLRVHRFPLPILIPPTSPHLSIIRGWYNRPNSDRRTKWAQSHPTPRNNKKKSWLKHSFDLLDKTVSQVNGVFFLPNASRITVKTSILSGVLLIQQNHIRTHAATKICTRDVLGPYQEWNFSASDHPNLFLQF
jgi:hypothetical protein